MGCILLFHNDAVAGVCRLCSDSSKTVRLAWHWVQNRLNHNESICYKNEVLCSYLDLL